MKKFLLMLSCLLCLFTISGCTTVSNVISETEKEVSKEVVDVTKRELSELNIQEVLSFSQLKDTYILNKEFSGTVFIMADKDLLKKISQHDFYLEEVPFESVIEGSKYDFNIRYDGKTYFAVKELSVNQLTEIKINSEWNKNLLIVLRKME